MEDKIEISMIRKDFNEFKGIIADEITKNNLSDIIKINSTNENSSIQLFVINQRSNDSRLYLTVLNVYAYDFIPEYDKKANKKSYKKCYDNEYSIDEYYNELNLSYDKSNYLLFGINQKPYNFLIFRSEKVFPLKKIRFGENMYNCPVNTHYYLKKLYRDYHNIPQEISMPKTVDKFRYIENSSELYNEAITKLKQTNSNF